MISRRRIFIGYLVVALVLQAGAAWAVKYSFTSFNYPGSDITVPSDINNSGQIVGHYGVGEISHGFLKEGTKYTTIDYPGAIQTSASGINDAGQIVGDYHDGNNPYSFLKEGSSYSTILPPEPLNLLTAYDINNSGHIVGVGEDGFHVYLFLKVGNDYDTFLVPTEWWVGMGSCYINDIDQIGGHSYYYNPPISKHRGFLLEGSIFIPFDYPGAIDTFAYGTNSAGQIVGYYRDSLGVHGFVKAGDTYASFDYPGAIGTEGYGINDLGQIVGAYFDGKMVHGFLATPVPLPSSLLFLATGLLGLVGWGVKEGVISSLFLGGLRPIKSLGRQEEAK